MNAATLITAYYDAFNRGDREAMLSMLTDDVAHDLNQGAREVGVTGRRYGANAGSA
ncbi:nuclear transport factor 2 family protein [Burkholderia cepacia]|uniref:hypothetical protein n=1 Tax=Burkholderia cepacia TaxID=292 RepID=UPI001CF47C69|nr:hypothetical protein [Burkholderia cepacia]MCA8081989.1 hypothetical protein [Burkholderia cepacia]